MSRGIARRTLFESRSDVRTFLALLAGAVRRGDLEVHVYSILTTHFHLLVRSPRGGLSRAMQRILDAYARWFNRGRRRDGPLFRGRFVNRIVESEAYFRAVVRYIDHNPVGARMARTATAYPYGSAWHYARSAGPPWLERATVEGVLRSRREGPWDPRDYACFADAVPGPGTRWLAERRLRGSGPGREDPLDDLLAAAPGRVRDWMMRKARLADGTSPGWTLVSPSSIRRCLGAHLRARGPREVALGRRRAPFGEVLEAGLLRNCAGLRLDEVARTMGLTCGTARNRVLLFAEAAGRQGELLEEASAILESALSLDHGRRSGRGSPWRVASESGTRTGPDLLAGPAPPPSLRPAS